MMLLAKVEDRTGRNQSEGFLGTGEMQLGRGKGEIGGKK